MTIELKLQIGKRASRPSVQYLAKVIEGFAKAQTLKCLLKVLGLGCLAACFCARIAVGVEKTLMNQRLSIIANGFMESSRQSV